MGRPMPIGSSAPLTGTRAVQCHCSAPSSSRVQSASARRYLWLQSPRPLVRDFQPSRFSNFTISPFQIIDLSISGFGSSDFGLRISYLSISDHRFTEQFSGSRVLAFRISDLRITVFRIPDLHIYFHISDLHFSISDPGF